MRNVLPLCFHALYNALPLCRTAAVLNIAVMSPSLYGGNFVGVFLSSYLILARKTLEKIKFNVELYHYPSSFLPTTIFLYILTKIYNLFGNMFKGMYDERKHYLKVVSYTIILFIIYYKYIRLVIITAYRLFTFSI